MFFFLTSNPLDAPVRWQTWCCPKETPGHLRTIVWSCHTYERSCHTYERPAAMTRPLANSPMSILDMTHSYVWHDSFICVTWFVYNVFIRLVLVDSFIHWVIWQCIILLMWHMTYAYVWHDSFLCVTWIIYMCDMTHSINSLAIFSEYEADFLKYIPDSTTQDMLLKSQNEFTI